MTPPVSTPRNAGPLVLALNAGSSSLKFAVFASETRLLSGKVDRIGMAESTLAIQNADGPTERKKISASTHADCLHELFEKIPGIDILAAVGHRIVHGGPRFADPVRIESGVLDELRRLAPFAPEHLPAEISLIEAVSARLPKLAQVACFDTAFHRDLPRRARLLAIPLRLEAAGIRRYGFHGLSFEFLLEELGRIAGPVRAKGKVILAHLGNGASLAAVLEGKCIDTSMAFTPAAGLMMGRRSGDLDPGLAAYLSSTMNVSGEQFHRMVNHESGLLGVSEISPDVRELLEQEARDSRAADALSLFCYQATKWIGSFAAALGGLDTLVFSGGIGENHPRIRKRICASLGFLGIELDDPRNEQNSVLISSDSARVPVHVLATNEERMISRGIGRVLAAEQERGKK